MELKTACEDNGCHRYGRRGYYCQPRVVEARNDLPWGIRTGRACVDCVCRRGKLEEQDSLGDTMDVKE